MDFLLTAICLGLHALATVILTGQYILSALVILPVLMRQTAEKDQARMLAAFTAAARPWVLGALTAFLVTGIVMMLTDSQYLGFLNFGNAWSVLMVVKHVLIVPWVFLCIALDRNTARRLEEANDADRPRLLAQFRRMNTIAAWGGAGIILMTAVMQAM
jgi:uncharacterized membrane protein